MERIEEIRERLENALTHLDEMHAEMIEHADYCLLHDAVSSGLILADTLTAQQKEIEQLSAERDATGDCHMCEWHVTGRHQKCNCCVKNEFMKNCYEPASKTSIELAHATLQALCGLPGKGET